jgi:uncharacterized DUF497 family protein
MADTARHVPLPDLQVCTDVHTIVHMDIEFDPDNAARNPKVHDGVTFEEAEAVLFDPYALTREDAVAENEARFVSLGMGARGRVLVVVWTLRGERIRIISAWKANQPQQRRYEQQFRPPV